MLKLEKKYVVTLLVLFVMIPLAIFFVMKQKSDNSSIKVGAILPLTKSGAHFGLSAKNGINMCIDEINNSGGINGKNIKYIEYDDEGDPSKALSGYNLLKDEGVSAVIIGGTSAEALAVVEEAKNDDIPIVVTAASAQGITYNSETNELFENVFRIGLTNEFQGKKMAKFAKNKKMNNVSVLYTAEDDYSSGLKDIFVSECKSLGLNVSTIENFSLSSIDFNAQLSNIKSKHPDAIFVPAYYEVDGLIAQQARNLGITCPILGTDSWGGVTNSTADLSYLNNCFYCSSFSPDDPSELSKKFSDDYKSKFGQIPNMLSSCGYDATKVLMSSVKDSMNKNIKINSDDFRKDIIKKLKSTNIDCVAGNIKFDEHHNPQKEAIIIQIKNGKEQFYQKI